MAIILFMNKLIESKRGKILFMFLLIGFFVPRGVSLPFRGLSVRQVGLDKSSNYSGLLLDRAYAQGEAKYIIFGPYVPLSPGKYEITFTLKIADNKTPQPLATIDVVAKKAQKLFASRTLKGTDFKSPNTYQDFNLQFDTTRGARDFEFRIKYHGSSRLWAKKIGIARVQSYSQEEAVGADLIKGATKSSSVVTEAESFLKRSRHREIGINDPRLSRRYLISDSPASGGQALMVEPGIVETGTSSIEPWEISKSWLLLVFGFIAGCLFILIVISIYQKTNVINRLGQLERKISKYASREYPLLVALVIGVALSVFSENLVLFGFALKGEYLFILYIVLSLIWKMDSRISIAVALLFLASCPLLLIYKQEQLAEKIAIYAYYFLVFGVVFQFKEYIVEARLPREEALSVEKTQVSEELVVVPISDAESRVEWRRKKRQRVRRYRLVAIIVSLVVGLFAVGIFLWAKMPDKSGNYIFERLLNKPATKGSSRASSTTTEQKARPKYASEKKEKRPIGKSDIKVQVLNGNGIQGEAAAIGNLLKGGGFNIIGTENADNFDYSETIIRYKSGLGELAGLVKQQIADRYTGVLREDLPSEYGVDIEVILGRKAQ